MHTHTHTHLSQLVVHDVHVSSVNPVAVVHGREGNPDLVHFDSSHHHVCRVQRVDEVGREGRGLPLDRDGKAVVLLSDVNALQKRLYLARGGMVKGCNSKSNERKRA